MKFLKDLEDIKARRKEIENEIRNAGGDEGNGDKALSKREEKEMKKLLKEKDKLERDALIQRMMEKDKQDTKHKIGSVVENQAASLEDRLKHIPELRKVSR